MNKFGTCLCFCGLVCVSLYSLCVSSLSVKRQARRSVSKQQDALSYLYEFGYTTSARGGILAEIRDEESAARSAITAFQKVWGLEVTGELTDETLELMNRDRCGNKDDILFLKAQGLTKRFNVVDKWDKDSLTYGVTTYSSKLTKDEVDKAVKLAADLWSEHSKLSFSQKVKDPDIGISFVEGDHGDEVPFTGPGGTLAHAFYPTFGGDLHLDDSEPWTFFKQDGKEVTQLIVHEMGHTLGLEHTSRKNAIMNPYYAYKKEIKLEQDDINGIIKIYGKVVDAETTTTAPPSTDKWCKNPGVDAAFMGGDGVVYAFRGDELGVFDRKGLRPEYPVKITAKFPALTSKVDAALVLPTVYVCLNREDRNYYPCLMYDTLFFIGSVYIRYRSGYVIGTDQISTLFEGLPSHLDSAFLASNNKIYFTKGEKIYRYTRGQGLDEGYPKLIIRQVPELPNRIDAVLGYFMKFEDKVVYTHYFFSQREYYLVADGKRKLTSVEPPYPRDISRWWLRCPDDGDDRKERESDELEPTQTQDKMDYWANDVLNFEPVLPPVEGYFDVNGKPLDLDDARAVLELKFQIVDAELDPRNIPTYNEDLASQLAAGSNVTFRSAGANRLHPTWSSLDTSGLLGLIIIARTVLLES